MQPTKVYRIVLKSRIRTIGIYIKQIWNQREWGKELEIQGLQVSQRIVSALPNTAAVSQRSCTEAIVHKED